MFVYKKMMILNCLEFIFVEGKSIIYLGSFFKKCTVINTLMKNHRIINPNIVISKSRMLLNLYETYTISVIIVIVHIEVDKINFLSILPFIINTSPKLLNVFEV